MQTVPPGNTWEHSDAGRSGVTSHNLVPVPAKPHEIAPYLQHLAEDTKSKSAVEDACHALAWVHSTVCLQKEARITTEVTSFMETYSELIDTLDRARNHKESLTKATQRGRIPAKLRITTKPMVVNREDPKFVVSWERTLLHHHRTHL